MSFPPNWSPSLTQPFWGVQQPLDQDEDMHGINGTSTALLYDSSPSYQNGTTSMNNLPTAPGFHWSPFQPNTAVTYPMAARDFDFGSLNTNFGMPDLTTGLTAEVGTSPWGTYPTITQARDLLGIPGTTTVFDSGVPPFGLEAAGNNFMATPSVDTTFFDESSMLGLDSGLSTGVGTSYLGMMHPPGMPLAGDALIPMATHVCDPQNPGDFVTAAPRAYSSPCDTVQTGDDLTSCPLLPFLNENGATNGKLVLRPGEPLQPFAGGDGAGYNCPEPGCRATKPFGRASDLERHIRTIHGTEKFWCPNAGCKRAVGGGGKPFNRKDKRDEHVKTVHKGKGN